MQNIASEDPLAFKYFENIINFKNWNNSMNWKNFIKKIKEFEDFFFLF